MPDWASDKQGETAAAKIQEAMAALEADAKPGPAEEERRIETSKNNSSANAEGRKKPGKPAPPLYRTNLIPRRNATSPILTAAL